MSNISCPACGLQMLPGAFNNCPNCHTLIDETPPAPEPETETEDEAETETETEGDEEE